MVIDPHFLRRQNLAAAPEHGDPVTDIEVRSNLNLGVYYLAGAGNQVLPANFAGLDDAP